MKGVVFSHLLYGEVINREDKYDGAGFVFPKAWRCGCFVVTVFVEALTQQVVGKAASLGEAVYSFPYFEVDPSVVGDWC